MQSRGEYGVDKEFKDEIDTCNANDQEVNYSRAFSNEVRFEGVRNKETAHYENTILITENGPEVLTVTEDGAYV